jgi:2'-5' RNA ligase
MHASKAESPKSANGRLRVALPIESALVVLAPQAEGLVGSFRLKYDPSAAEGMPAHITTLYPFLPPERIDDATLGILRQCFVEFAPFQFSLTAIKRLASDVLYLMPEPAETFRELTRTVWDRYPQTPPYGGKHSDIQPHLTVAQLADERKLRRVAEEFTRASQGNLPIRAAASDVALMDNKSGRWQVRERLLLGG